MNLSKLIAEEERSEQKIRLAPTSVLSASLRRSLVNINLINFLGDGKMTDYKAKSIRFAETKGHKYSIMIVPVDDVRADIIEMTNNSVTARSCNIPKFVVNQRFDSIIAEALQMDGIKYIEKK